MWFSLYYIKDGGLCTAIWNFSKHSGYRDKALLVLGSNMAKQAALTALLDPSTHFQPPLTHTTGSATSTSATFH